MLYKAKHIHPRKMQRRRFAGKAAALALSLTLLAGGIAIGTVAWLVDNTTPVTNTFQPSKVTCQVNEPGWPEGENAENGIKKDISITNTSNIDAYIRVRLVSYNKVNDKIVGGAGSLPEDAVLDLEGKWEKIGDYYYCKTPVKTGKNTPVLIKEYQLAEGQVLEILAEAIQADGVSDDGIPAVTDAWGVAVDDNGVITGSVEGGAGA